MTKDELLKLSSEVLQNANEEDQYVLELLLNGLKKKQFHEKGSYIGALLHAEGEYKEHEFKLTIPNTPIIQNALNIVHGGITATLLDSAMGGLVHHILPPDKAAVTTEIKINYVAPGVGKELSCVAGMIHKGNKTVVTEGKVFRDDGTLIAHSTASFFIINRS
ncbi:PaaI family thioesterase [Metabacillus litoralis]|uniref:PaaI family thioesterase n=1 Tax=Metabacillus TaxID=2675233 RepID=UPI000EF6087E|nr:PaaI family thioesterase [Metabacillus litoralis]MCM3160370.1 PaaI family thioesterase [Metabacillus litoralis]MCM3408955.1 PaaI family thioesterase [Metabacillus litoralis]UHA59407.1 PaaI family thioesterase [Metabacillus litoralis]